MAIPWGRPLSSRLAGLVHGGGHRRSAAVAGEIRPAAAGAGTAARRLLPVGAVNPKVTGKARGKLIEAARAGEDLDEDKARHVHVIEYEVPGRDGDGKGEQSAALTIAGHGAPGDLPPDQQQCALARVMADITGSRHLNKRRDRSYPRVVKRARHNSYRVKKPGDHGTRHDSPPAIQLANPVLTKAMTSIAA